MDAGVWGQIQQELASRHEDQIMQSLWNQLQANRSSRAPAQEATSPESYGAQEVQEPLRPDAQIGEPMTDQDFDQADEVLNAMKQGGERYTKAESALIGNEPTPSENLPPQMNIHSQGPGPKSHIEMKRVPVPGSPTGSGWSIKQIMDQ